eukprot:m.59554 g.59554  ORF g.59554 m.59554 type:complete len:53 (+) comp34887_c0_seq1:927-1085(+)
MESHFRPSNRGVVQSAGAESCGQTCWKSARRRKKALANLHPSNRQKFRELKH